MPEHSRFRGHVLRDYKKIIKNDSSRQSHFYINKKKVKKKIKKNNLQMHKVFVLK